MTEKNAVIAVLEKRDFKDETITKDKRCLIIIEVSTNQDI